MFIETLTLILDYAVQVGVRLWWVAKFRLYFFNRTCLHRTLISSAFTLSWFQPCTLSGTDKCLRISQQMAIIWLFCSICYFTIYNSSQVLFNRWLILCLLIITAPWQIKNVEISKCLFLIFCAIFIFWCVFPVIKRSIY